VLTGGGGAVLLLALGGSSVLAGCRSAGSAATVTPPPTPTPDEVLRRRAATRVHGLLGQVGTPPVLPALAGVFAQLAQGYREQLTALGEPLPAPTTGTGGPTAAGVPATLPTTGATSPSVPPAAVVAAQLGAADEALADCAAASAPGLAVLLARLAAAHGAEADLLSAAARLPAPGPVTPAAPATTASRTTASRTTAPGPTTTGMPASNGTSPASTAASRDAGSPASGGSAGTSGTTPAPATSSLGTEQVNALTRLLQGEHAAVYAYGVVAAWVAPTLRARAHDFWSGHLTDRDALTELLRSGAATAPPGSAAYDVGPLPSGSPAAVALAAKVEQRLATVADSAVAGTSDGARLAAAGILVSSARRQAAWAGSTAALPGGG
jgi:hypothetical protein